MIRALIAAAALNVVFAGPVLAAKPIEGSWKGNDGTIIKFSPCGTGFCGIVQNGEHKGKSVSAMAGKGNSYKGTFTDLATNKTYTGEATVSGSTLEMKGCVARSSNCKTLAWSKQ
jgi:uncharacterized protein (DUF2147 family)